MSAELIDIGRDTATVQLFDTKKGEVILYTSLTGLDQEKLLPAFEGKKGTAVQFELALETITLCFVSWNIGKNGAMLECNPENLKKFTQRDIFAMLQVCTGRQLLDEKGNMLSEEEAAKKAVGA